LELIQLKANTYVLRGATNVGVYIEDKKCWLVDTPDEKKTRNLVDYLESQGYRIEGTFLTHFHVDHTRGCARLQKMCEASIYAPIGELSMVRFPILEGYMLYGAHPPKELRKGFFESKPSQPQPLETAPEILQKIELPGHTLDHTGFLTPDGVLFSGDAYFGKTVLKKYRYPYLTDVARSLASLEYLKEVGAEYYVPSHGEPTTNPERDVEAQISAIEKAIDNVFSALKEPKTVEGIVVTLGYVDESSEIGMWFLARSFVASVVSFLSDRKEVCPALENGRVIWKRC